MRCECCGEELPDDTTAWKITILSEGGTNLRGHFVGDLVALQEFASAMTPYGLVAASPLTQEDRR